MPTIKIKQFDNTSAGVLTQPKNVFLIGLGTSETSSDESDETTPNIIESDINGIYYFTSVEDFYDTIGKREPTDLTYSSKDGTEYLCKSYGNQMAAELLTMGYNVYYYCIKTTADFAAIVSGTKDWSCLSDISLYPIDYIATGFVGAGCYDLISILKTEVGNRNGDCLLLVDIPTENNYLKCVKTDKSKENSSLLTKLAAESKLLTLDRYCAPFAPVCNISGLNTAGGYKNNTTLPASFYYLACAINAEENLGYRDWFAVAGLTRGRRSDRIAIPTIAFGDRDATSCAPRSTQDATSYKFNYAINLVVKQAGGFYIWGNRTGHVLNSEGLTAEHFLNIQRLCMSLKKRIYSTCKRLTFDPNSDILWSNFVGGIEPLLKDMQANQGITGYKIVRVKSASDPKAMMKAKIRIIPIEAVEDFELEISLEDLIEA